MFICVFNDCSIANFHWKYVSDSIFIVARCVNAGIDFNGVGIAGGRISLPHLLLYDMSIVTEHICIFIDCTYIEIVTEHTS